MGRTANLDEATTECLAEGAGPTAKRTTTASAGERGATGPTMETTLMASKASTKVIGLVATRILMVSVVETKATGLVAKMVNSVEENMERRDVAVEEAETAVL